MNALEKIMNDMTLEQKERWKQSFTEPTNISMRHYAKMSLQLIDRVRERNNMPVLSDDEVEKILNELTPITNKDEN